MFNGLNGISMGGEPVYNGRESDRVSLAGLPSDIRSLRLAPGHYRVLATRGMEYTVETASFEARAGEALVLDIAAPAPAVATPGPGNNSMAPSGIPYLMASVRIN